MPDKSLELRHTVWLIRELDTELEDIETDIAAIVDLLNSPITLAFLVQLPHKCYILETLCVRKQELGAKAGAALTA